MARRIRWLLALTLVLLPALAVSHAGEHQHGGSELRIAAAAGGGACAADAACAPCALLANGIGAPRRVDSSASPGAYARRREPDAPMPVRSAPRFAGVAPRAPPSSA